MKVCIRTAVGEIFEFDSSDSIIVCKFTDQELESIQDMDEESTPKNIFSSFPKTENVKVKLEVSRIVNEI